MNRKKEIWAIFIGLASLSLLVLITIFSIVFSNYIYLVFSFALFWITSVILSFYILNSTRISNIKLCWIFVCLSLPLIGVTLFLLFGINPLRKKNLQSYLKRQESLNKFENYDDTNKFLVEQTSSEIQQIVQYGYNISHRPIYFQNAVKIINPQPDFYKETISLIREAKKTICMQFYIYADSVFFKTVISEIVKKAKDGVKVYIIYDWVGINRRVKKRIWKKLMQLSSNIKVSVFNPWSFTIFTSKTNFRSHRKCIIVDNKKAIYGGSNISDEYLCFRSNTSIWSDLNCVIEGPIVNSLSLLFKLDWIYYCRQINPTFCSNKLLEIPPVYFLPIGDSNDFVSNGKFLEVKSQLFDSSPDYNEKSVRDLILQLIGKAKKRIWIITPYFIVGEDIMNVLRAAALSGVDVKIILPGQPDDKKYILTVNRSSYLRLIEVNIHVYEYQGFCHSKLIIFDNELVTLGTFNFDFRSFYINFESALLLISKDLNKYCESYFKKMLENCTRINANSFSSRLWKRIYWRMSLINVYHPLM